MMTTRIFFAKFLLGFCLCFKALTSANADDDGVYISGYIEGKGFNKGIQLFNAGSAEVNLQKFVLLEGDTTSSTPTPASERKSWFLPDYRLFPGQAVLITNPYATYDLSYYAKIDLPTFTPNGDDWVQLGTINEAGGFDRLDTVGDTTTKGPWGNAQFSSLLEEHQLTRTRRVKGADYSKKWNVAEWSVVDQEPYSYFTYHLDPDYLCASHQDCSENSFCGKSKRCKLCKECAFNSDGIDGKCPTKCPAACEGSAPKAELCPLCSNGKFSTPKALTKVPIIPSASIGTSHALAIWCEDPGTWDQVPGGRTSAKSFIEILIQYTDAEDQVIKSVAIDVKTSDTQSVSSPPEGFVSGGCAPYQFNVTEIFPFQPFHIRISPKAECVAAPSTASDLKSTPESAPSWILSVSEQTVKEKPKVTGSTSSLAVVQWPQPRLNCEPPCEIVEYKLEMKTGNKEWKDVSEYIFGNGRQTTALVRNLKSKNLYVFRVTARNKLGWGPRSDSSLYFTLVAEVPDKPSYLLFATPESGGDVARVVSVQVIPGKVNGASVDYFEVEFSGNGTRIVNNSTSDSIRVDGLEPGKSYSVTGRVRNSRGWSPRSIPFEYTTPNPDACTKEDYDAHVSQGKCQDDSTRLVSFSVMPNVTCNSPEVAPLSSQTITCEYVPYTSTAGYTTMILAGAGVLLCFAWLSWFYKHKKKPLVKAAQPVFLLSLCGAAMAMCASTVLLLGNPTKASCALRIWVPNIAFTVLFGTLVSKLWRVYQLFASEKAMNMSKRKVTASSASWVLFSYLFFNVCVLLAWQLIDPYQPRPSKVDLPQYPGEDLFVPVCQSEHQNIFPVILSSSHIILVLCGLYMASKCREVSKKFAEKNEVTLSVYQTTILAVLGGIVVAGASVPIETKTLVIAIAIFFGSVGCVTIFAYPKWKRGVDTLINTTDLMLKSQRTFTTDASPSGVTDSFRGHSSTLISVSGGSSERSPGIKMVVNPGKKKGSTDLAPSSARNFALATPGTNVRKNHAASNLSVPSVEGV